MTRCVAGVAVVTRWVAVVLLWFAISAQIDLQMQNTHSTHVHCSSCINVPFFAGTVGFTLEGGASE